MDELFALLSAVKEGEEGVSHLLIQYQSSRPNS
jgi:hypothetical protein